LADSRIIARFLEAVPATRADRRGITLCFEPLTGRLGTARIEDWAEIGPDLSTDAVEGIGKVLRILRVARIAVRANAEELAGEPDRLLTLLERAVGTELRLVLRRRSLLHFLVWTEEGFTRVEDISEVEELEDAYVVRPRGARFPRRFPRERVIRQKTDCERWLEVVEIRRPD
jgi:hypothetical protein